APPLSPFVPAPRVRPSSPSLSPHERRLPPRPGLSKELAMSPPIRRLFSPGRLLSFGLLGVAGLALVNGYLAPPATRPPPGPDARPGPGRRARGGGGAAGPGRTHPPNPPGRAAPPARPGPAGLPRRPRLHLHAHQAGAHQRPAPADERDDHDGPQRAVQHLFE